MVSPVKLNAKGQIRSILHPLDLFVDRECGERIHGTMGVVVTHLGPRMQS